MSNTPSDIVGIERLFLHYYRPLCLYALRFLGEIDKAEDVVQDCFVKILENGASSPSVVEKSYLFQTVRNRCIDELRRHSKPTAPIPLNTTAAEHIVSEEDEEDAFEAARLWTAIDTLPDRCREVFLLAKRDGLTYREIAEELAISERTVEHHIAKALRMLRRKISIFLNNLF